MDNCRYSKVAELYFGEIEDGQIILRDENKKKTHVLNTSAAEIWDMCVDITVENLIETYLQSFEFIEQENLNEARNALQNTVELLIREGLIQSVAEKL